MSKFASDENVQPNGGDQERSSMASCHNWFQADPDLFSGIYMLTLSTNSARLMAGTPPLISHLHAVNNAGPTFANGLEYWSLSPDFLSGLGAARVGKTTLTFLGVRNPGPVAPLGFPAPDAGPLFTMLATPPSSSWQRATTLPQKWFHTSRLNHDGSTSEFGVTFDSSSPPKLTWYRNDPPTSPLVTCGTPTVFTYSLAPSPASGTWLQLNQPSALATPGQVVIAPSSSPAMQSTSLALAEGMLFQACAGRDGAVASLSVFASNDGCAWTSFPALAAPVSVDDSVAPAITATEGGQLCVAYLDASARTILASAFSPSARDWLPSTTVASGRAPSSPALAVLDSALYAAYQDDGAIQVSKSRDFGGTWTSLVVSSVVGLSGAPALAALPAPSSAVADKLYLAVASGTNIVVFSSPDGAAWSPLASLAPRWGAWSGGVALAEYNGSLYLAATSSTGLQVMSSSDGARWSDSLTLAWTSTAGAFNPAISALNGSLLVVSYLQGTAPNAKVNYAYLR